MRISPQYQPLEANSPLRGLYTSLPSTRLDPSFSPRLLNVLVRDGVITRRPGYHQIGQRLVGTVRRLVEPNLIDAATGDRISPLVVLTDRRQYKYDNVNDVFIDITPNEVDLPIIGVNQGTKKFTVAGDQTTIFPVGRPFPVEASTGNDGVYTTVGAVFGGVNTEIEVSEAIPDATVDGNIDIRDDWTQTPTDGYIDTATATDLQSSRMLITNGVEQPRQWDGTDEFTLWEPDYDNFQTCKTFAVHADHLFLGGIVAQTHEPATIAWSDVGSFDSFQEGTAGAQILTDVVGEIRALKPLGDRLVVYSNDSIITGIFVGLPAVFAFETVIPKGIRLGGAKAIVSIDVGHIYASEENFYLFDGSRGLRTLGNPVKTDYKVTKDTEHIAGASGLNDHSKRTIYLSFFDTSGEVTTYTSEYDPFNLGEMTWAKEQYADKVTAWGFYTNLTTLEAWEDVDASILWEDRIDSWFEESKQVGYPIRVFGSDQGYVFISDGSRDTDNGVAYTSYVETVDFTLPAAFLSALGRWLEIEFEALGVDVVVSYSKDLGQSYTTLETVTLGSRFQSHVVNMDDVSRTLRLKFETSSGPFQLRWIRVWVRDAGPR